MSGATMATGPRAKASAPGTPRGDAKERLREQEASIGGVMGSLSVIDLQLVAFIIVFSASGLVPALDLVFPVFLSAYAFFLSALVFPSYGPSKPPNVFKGNRAFQIWVVTGTAIGLFLALAYVLGGFAQGDTTAVRDAAPHLFLLSFQILTENIINSLGIFSLPVRSLLPILYTTRRLFALWGWVVGTWAHDSAPKHPGVEIPSIVPDDAWTWFGRSLAVANFLYFFINLFFFLIPMFLPRAFETYFNERAVYLSQHQGKGKGRDWLSYQKHKDSQKDEQAKKSSQNVHPNQTREPEKKAH